VERTENWDWFLRDLRTVIFYDESATIPLNNMSEYHIISDRNKGLLEAVATTFPRAIHLMCMKHLERNIRKFCKDTKVIEQFKKCVYSRTIHQLEENMNKIMPLSIQTYNYLSTLDRKAWTYAEWTGPRYGVVTSNMSESLNNQIMKYRYMET
jgi:transposase-like protein